MIYLIDRLCSWLVRYEDNDEEDLEWLELKPLLAQAAAAAQAAGGAKKGAASKPRAAPKRSGAFTAQEHVSQSLEIVSFHDAFRQCAVN